MMNLLKYILFFFTAIASAQTNFTITGHFGKVENKQIVLKRYNVSQEIKLDESKADSKGNFSIQYPADYVGAAVLEVANEKKLIILLNHENFEIYWDDLNSISGLRFVNSLENSAFDQGLHLYQTTEEKKAGILYLLPYYKDEPQKKQFLTDELAQLTSLLPDYLSKLPAKSYVGYYLKIRILIADLQLSGQRHSLLSELESRFNSLNFDDEHLLNSGLYDDLLENYFIAMENYGDRSSEHINKSIDVVIGSLGSRPELKQEIATHLFNFLEKRSSFDSAKHLALLMLDDDSCKLDDKHKALFEQYRKMAVGNTAPDIKFMTGTSIHQLSGLKNKYKLVIFGASWCPKCVEEIPKFKTYYTAWKKNYDLEIVFISLDTQKSEFEGFTKNFPWLSSCDFKGWETKASTDYCVFATPTMYLLDSANTIQLKPISADQVDAWLNFHK